MLWLQLVRFIYLKAYNYKLVHVLLYDVPVRYFGMKIVLFDILGRVLPSGHTVLYVVLDPMNCNSSSDVMISS